MENLTDGKVIDINATTTAHICGPVVAMEKNGHVFATVCIEDLTDEQMKAIRSGKARK